MEKVYRVTHSRKVEEDARETKTIGFFSTKQEAERIIKQFKTKEGFKNYPDDYIIQEFIADMDEFNDKPGNFVDTVYVLTHEYSEDEYDYVTQLGMYSSMDKAKESLSKYRAFEEFKDRTDGFSISEDKIGDIYWKEGFFTY